VAADVVSLEAADAWHEALAEAALAVLAVLVAAGAEALAAVVAESSVVVLVSVAESSAVADLLADVALHTRLLHLAFGFQADVNSRFLTR
jgi:hypothetical protein